MISLRKKGKRLEDCNQVQSIIQAITLIKPGGMREVQNSGYGIELSPLSIWQDNSCYLIIRGEKTALSY